MRAQRQWLQQLEKGIEQFVAASGIPHSIMHSLTEAPQNIRDILQSISLVWPLLMDMMGEQERLRFEQGRVPENLRQLLSNMKGPLQPLLLTLDKLNDMLQKYCIVCITHVSCNDLHGFTRCF